MAAGTMDPGAVAEGAAPAVAALRVALHGYSLSRSPAVLDQAFGAAGVAIAALRGERAREPVDVSEIESLIVRLPEFELLLSLAADETQRAAHQEGRRLWAWFGFRSAPPAWEEAERSAAQVLIACACARIERFDPVALRLGLLRPAAQRWADRIAEELRKADEQVWRRALGDRYESVRLRYAHRTRLRVRELAELFRTDTTTVVALRERLARWVAAGCDLDALPLELEAAFAGTRTPARLG
jgi:hypothetical protein